MNLSGLANSGLMWATQPCPPGFVEPLWSYAPAGAILLLGLLLAVHLTRRDREVLAFIVACVSALGAGVALVIAGFTAGCVPV